MRNNDKQSERVKAFKQHFMEHHENGWDVLRISQHYGISRRYAYNLLDDIATSNNVPRKSLLSVPHKQHASPNRVLTNNEVSTQEIKETFEKILDNTQELIARIDLILSEEDA